MAFFPASLVQDQKQSFLPKPWQKFLPGLFQTKDLKRFITSL
jgi:hypothetical protein